MDVQRFTACPSSYQLQICVKREEKGWPRVRLMYCAAAAAAAAAGGAVAGAGVGALVAADERANERTSSVLVGVD